MKKHIFPLINTVTRLFTILVLLFTLIAVVANLTPEHERAILPLARVVAIFIFSCALGILNVVRAQLESKQWMLRLSFIQKRWVFFPFYLLTVILFIYYGRIVSPFSFLEISILSVIFIVLALGITILVEKNYKRAKQDLTGLVNTYKNEIGGD